MPTTWISHLAAGVATLVTVVLLAAGAGPATAAPAGRIFYTAPGCGVASIRPGGDGYHCLTLFGRDPSVSHDGKRIVWTLGNSVWVMDADGSGRHRVAGDPDPNDGIFMLTIEGKFSPDGRHITFTRAPEAGGGHVWVMNADGSGQRLITPEGGVGPDWSPDGRHIAYESGRGIEVVDMDGGNRQLLLANRDEVSAQGQVFERNEDPHFSPDGQHIVFGRVTRTTTYQCSPFPNCQRTVISDGDVYVMNADGSDVRRLSATPDVDEVDPSYSRDGSQIAYFHSPKSRQHVADTPPEDQGDVYVMNADGSGQHRVTGGSNPWWSAVTGGAGRLRVTLSGLPRGCARRMFKLRVRVSAPSEIKLFVDGRRVPTAGEGFGRRDDSFINAGAMKPGRHQVRVVAKAGPERVIRTVTFTRCAGRKR